MCVRLRLNTCVSQLSRTLHLVCLFSGLQGGAKAESRAEDEAEAELSLQEHRADQDNCCLGPMKYIVHNLIKYNVNALAFFFFFCQPHLKNW